MQPGDEALNSSETLALVERFRQGDQEAERLLFDRYSRRLLDLVASRLPPGVARRFGPEDVVQSVLGSLCRALKEGSPTLERSGDLWAWLLQITFNKLSNRIAFHLAAKRSVMRENDLPKVNESAYGQDFVIWSREPSVEDLAAIADELDYLFGPHEATLRRVVDLRLQDFTVTEIAERLGVSHTTVGRHLKKIVRRFEDRWRSLLENGPLAEGTAR